MTTPLASRPSASDPLRAGSSAPRPLASPPADVYACSRPALAFTGDFYFFDTVDGTLRFCVGDVAGKGLSSAVLMAMLHEVVEERFGKDSPLDSPEELAVLLSSELRCELPTNRFVSLVAGRFDPDGALELVNAGHCPAVLRRSRGGIETLGPTGPVIGPFPGPSWQSLHTRLEPGDTLVLYTDGVLEASSPEGGEFGQARIERSLETAPAAPARAIAEHLLCDVAAFRGRVDLGDDTTVMAILT